ncbi:MAG: hypothetical protein IRZ16_06090 [Myxococcaceae bacterium]|nr:hypothetical protein [Myxococcaceae bacterium]
MIHGIRITSVVAVVVALTLGCGWKRTGTSPKEEIGGGGVSTVELTLHNVTQEQAKKFMEDLDDYGDIEKIELKTWANGTAVYVIDVDGCECDLPAMMGKIPEPGFTYQGRTTRISYTAFDNRPPSLTFVQPEDGFITKDKQIQVVVQVPDEDVAQVTINGKPTSRSGDKFSVTLPLSDGANDIVAVAKDKTGNESKAQIRVGLDATPPEVTATVTVLIEGDVEPGTRVIVNGEEVPVDGDGHYEAKVKVKKGQKEVEVIAIDSHGNRTETMRPIGE